jgi:TctA family transporter
MGTLVGVLPGIGAMAAISMVLPITYFLEPTAAVVMLAGIFYGGEYGGSVSSILLNLPGTTSSAVVCLDGNPMAKQGRAGVALFTAAIASFVGGSLGIVILTVFSPLLAEVALAFHAGDYFALMLLGLIAASVIAQGSPVKSISMVVVGLLLGCVGIDINSGVPRFTMGFSGMYDGINLVALAMGLFGISEVISSIAEPSGHMMNTKVTLRSMLPTRADLRRIVGPILRGTGIGAFFGALPGTGVAIASFMAYAFEQRIAKDPSTFGQGEIKGVAAPESSNNAAAQTAFIPTLTLSIPGSPTMALMIGAFMIHGIAPGPTLLNEHPDVFWGLVASFWIGNVLLLVLNIPLIGIWVMLLRVRYKFLFPTIIVLICIGVYSINTNVFDISLVLVFGIAGYLMRILDFSPLPLLLGFVLGPMMEIYFRRAMLLSHGDPLVLLQEPISGSLLAITLVLLCWALWKNNRSLRRNEGRSLQK